MRNIGLFLTFVLLIGCVLFAYSIQTLEYRVTSRGQIKALGIDVFADDNLTTPLTSIDWGKVEPGGNGTVAIYIQSTSNTPIVLTLLTENWNPAKATRWMDLTWDYDGTSIQPAQTITVALTLSVSENIKSIKTFSFDITIIGEG